MFRTDEILGEMISVHVITYIVRCHEGGHITIDDRTFVIYGEMITMR
jgi:hypothetical protein